ncbi:KAT8 regulatory NSL complex subunit 1-like [Stegodyphus dumicola]|uniref:KAT8 regulatory NSL complex subunit 1-like n=1 Tax=Stegodyphus dumicola TaxID=202533 RepID=UPI0015ADDCB2|nr:KAT8 regulatory NSL complex subunit 1-like [Stegodyphus dumicola]
MRERMRRISVASSASSHESPVPSPFSLYEDGFDQSKKRRDDNQFDIDDVIIPCNSKSGRLVDIQYKEILIPSWRYREVTDVAEAETVETEETEDILEDTYIKRHEKLEVEEKKMLRSSALGLTGKSRRGRRHRCDSRADSSGANTPDPVLLYNQDIMFQVPNSIVTAGPSSPAASPPTTPSSATVMSDDSQPSYGNGSLARFEKRKFVIHKKTSEENANVHTATNDCDGVQPYEPHKFPLSDKEYEQLLAESTHLCTEDTDMTLSVPSFPASPESSTSSTSTVEEDEDITDPEWTVVKRDNGPDQALVLKFAKR